MPYPHHLSDPSFFAVIYEQNLPILSSLKSTSFAFFKIGCNI